MLVNVLSVSLKRRVAQKNKNESSLIVALVNKYAYAFLCIDSQTDMSQLSVRYVRPFDL